MQGMSEGMGLVMVPAHAYTHAHYAHAHTKKGGWLALQGGIEARRGQNGVRIWVGVS